MCLCCVCFAVNNDLLFSLLQYNQQLIIYTPRHILAPHTESGGFDSCQRFDLNYSSYTTDELLAWDRDVMVDNQTAKLECDNGWVYDQSVFVSTINSRVLHIADKSFI